MTHAIVYVPLLDEGTTVYRPVRATPLGGSVYRLASSVEPPDEKWAFPPNSHVVCAEHVFQGGAPGLLAIRLAPVPELPGAR